MAVPRGTAHIVRLGYTSMDINQAVSETINNELKGLETA